MLHVDKSGSREVEGKARQSSDEASEAFCFDTVWGSACTQKDVFDQVCDSIIIHTYTHTHIRTHTHT